MLVTPALSAGHAYLQDTPPLMERLTPEIVQQVFPDAERVELLDDGGPTAAAAYRGDALVGYIFSTLDVLQAPGYDGTPFDDIAGVDLNGRITGSVNLFHHEPLLIGNQRLTDSMLDYLLRMPGMTAQMGLADGPRPGLMVGATATARAMRNAIKDSARVVLGYRLGSVTVTEPTINLEAYSAQTPEALLADGSIVSKTITNGDLLAALQAAGAADAQLDVAPKGGADDVYIRIRTGLATPAMIGRNAAGPAFHDHLLANYPSGSQGIFLASSGPYDFHGFKFQNASTGYRLERLRVIQGDHTFEFDKAHYMKAGILLGTSGGIVVLPPESGFDPLEPWRVEILVQAKRADGSVATFGLRLAGPAHPDARA